MTDEEYGVSHPSVSLGATVAGSLRDTPHPTFAKAKATFSRKGRRNARATPKVLILRSALGARLEGRTIAVLGLIPPP